MLLNYTPDGQEKQTYQFKPEKLTSAEAETLERMTGWTYAEFGNKLVSGSAQARRLMLWVLQKRDHPTLKAADVQPLVGEIEIEFDGDEIAVMREQVLAANVDEADRAQALAALDGLTPAEAEPAPKAPSPNAESD